MNLPSALAARLDDLAPIRLSVVEAAVLDPFLPLEVLSALLRPLLSARGDLYDFVVDGEER